MTIDLKSLNLADATPIDFDNIREGDTVARLHDGYVRPFVVESLQDRMVWEADDAGYVNHPGVTWLLIDRPQPTVEPGTAGTATVRGVKGVRGIWAQDDEARMFLTAEALPGEADSWVHHHRADQVTDFVADPKPGTIPQGLSDALDAFYSVWNTRGLIFTGPEAHRVADEWRAHRAGESR